jgi:hypothetical protein
MTHHRRDCRMLVVSGIMAHIASASRSARAGERRERKKWK